VALAVFGFVALVMLATAVLMFIRARAPSPAEHLAYLVKTDNQVSLWLTTIGHTETMQVFAADDIHYLTLAGEERPTPFVAGEKGLLFVAREGYTTSLYRMDTGAEAPTLVMSHSGDIDGTFSPDGGLLLLHAREEGGQSRAFLLDGSGSKPAQTVGLGDAVEFALSPSRDTLWVKMSRSGQTRLDLVDGKGQTLAVLAENDAQAWTTYSPDEKRLLLWTAGVTEPLGALSLVETSRPQQRQVLLVVNAQGGGFVDGGRSVWVDRVDTRGHSLLLMDLSTQSVVEVANGATALQVYSGPGNTLFFVAESGGHNDLYAVEASGSRLRFCARDVSPVSVAITPDAVSAAFAVPSEGSWTLNLFDGQAVALTNRTSPTAPDFSADGKWLAFQETSGGESALWVSRRDRSERRLVAGGGYAAVWSR
jgi:Tol biopolymer transport system component